MVRAGALPGRLGSAGATGRRDRRQLPTLLLLEHPIASLADLLQPVPDMPQVRQAIIQAFSEEFDYQIIEEIHPFPGSSDEQRFDT
jgi:hypothetical protein